MEVKARMQVKKLAILLAAASLATALLTGCPWDKDDAASSDLPGGSSGSTSQGGDTGNTGGGTTPTEPKFDIPPTEGGTVDCVVTKNINGTYSVTFTITPKAGYIVDDTVMVGNTAYSLSELGVTPDANGAYTYTDNNVPAGTSVTVTVTFKDQGYTITDNGYEVRNADGLLAWNAAAQNDLSLNCTLTADIDLSDETWTPIGDSYSNAYTGTFDGQGHTISGLTIKTPNKDNVGLFGCIGKNGEKNGTVQNLNLEITSISGNDYVGGVAGKNHGTITGCVVSVGSEGNGQYARVGGVAGRNDGMITGCVVSGGSVKGSGQSARVGGVVGLNAGTVTDCYWQAGKDGSPDKGIGYDSTDQGSATPVDSWDTYEEQLKALGFVIKDGIPVPSMIANNGKDPAAAGLRIDNPVARFVLGL